MLTDAVWQRCMYPSKERLAEERTWWSKYLKRDVSMEETAEICHNVFGLFKILFEVDARERAKRAGLPVVDEEKVAGLQRDISHLEEQAKATRKMAGRWPKGEAQRTALEGALQALEEQLAAKRAEVSKELAVGRATVVAAPGAASSDPPPVSPAAPARPARRRSRRSSSP